MKRTRQELSQWAENIGEPCYGRVTQKLVREVIENRANAEERERGFTRDEIKIITEFVNAAQGEEGKR